MSNRFLLGVLVVCSVQPACHESKPPASLAELAGTVVSYDWAVCVPGSRWEAEPDAWTWFFQRSASVYCHVGKEAHGALTFSFVTKDPSEKYTFQWDGEALDEAYTSFGATGIKIEIPPEKLALGRHTLKLARRGPGRARIQEISVRSGFDSETFEPELAKGYQYVSDFIDLQATGATQVKRDGFLFIGSQSVEVALRGRSLTVDAENASSEQAEFDITVSGQSHRVEVEPSGSRRLRVALPAGETTATFRVRGEAGGRYLWGSPFIAGDNDEALTPIVLVSLDTTRKDALSPYGAARELTPNIERFASQATVYDNAYATAPWTLPSHASMFTGLYPSKHGLGVTDRRFEPGVVTLAERLREGGYFVAGFAGGELCASRHGLSRGFHRYTDPDSFETPVDHLSDYVELFLGLDHDKPLFLFANYFGPHALYEAPSRYEALTEAEQYKERLANAPVWGELLEGQRGAWRDVVYGKAPVSLEALSYLRAAYLAEVAFTDAQLGRLIAALERFDLYDRALIIVVADHGEALGERGYFTHSRRLDPEIMEIPLIIKWPGQTRGRRVAHMVSQIDLFPTMLDVAGLAPPASDGLALGQGGGEALEARSSLLMEEHVLFLHPPDPLFIAPHLYGIQKLGERHLVWEGGQECSRAPSWNIETCSEPWADVLSAIRQRLVAPDAVEGELGREALDRLQSLGYVR